MEHRFPIQTRVRRSLAGRVFVRRVAVGAWGLALLAACARDVPPASTTHERVVSLAPSITELLFAIGAGDAVVGRTRWVAEPPAAFDVPSVGDGLDPNVEAVAARRPDLVALYASPANAAAIEQLHQLGIETVDFRMDRLDDVPRGARLFGALTGTASRAESLATRFAGALDSARRVPRVAEPASVLILSWDQPPIVIGAGSFQSELVELAGARNVYDDLTLPSGQVSIESIVERNPDLVLLSGGTSDPEWANRPEWRAVPAVRERRFVVVSGSAFSYPSFRALDAVRQLAAALAEVPR